MNLISQAAPDGASYEGLPKEAHLQIAMEQVAMHAVQLAVARWTTGYLPQEAIPASTQSRWYAEMHGNFTAWLSAGGFAQAEPEPIFSDTALQQEAQQQALDDAATIAAPQHETAPPADGARCIACS